MRLYWVNLVWTWRSVRIFSPEAQVCECWRQFRDSNTLNLKYHALGRRKEDLKQKLVSTVRCMLIHPVLFEYSKAHAAGLQVQVKIHDYWGQVQAWLQNEAINFREYPNRERVSVALPRKINRNKTLACLSTQLNDQKAWMARHYRQ